MQVPGIVPETEYGVVVPRYGLIGLAVYRMVAQWSGYSNYITSGREKGEKGKPGIIQVM